LTSPHQPAGSVEQRRPPTGRIGTTDTPRAGLGIEAEKRMASMAEKIAGLNDQVSATAGRSRGIGES